MSNRAVFALLAFISAAYAEIVYHTAVTSPDECKSERRRTAFINECYESFAVKNATVDAQHRDITGVCVCSKTVGLGKITTDRNPQYLGECQKFLNGTDGSYNTTVDVLAKTCSYSLIAHGLFRKQNASMVKAVIGGRYLQAVYSATPFAVGKLNTTELSLKCNQEESTCISSCGGKSLMANFFCGAQDISVPTDFFRPLNKAQIDAKCECSGSPAPAPAPGPDPRTPVPGKKPDGDKKDSGLSSSWVIGIIAIVVGAVLVVVGGVYGYRRYSSTRGYSPIATA